MKLQSVFTLLVCTGLCSGALTAQDTCPQGQCPTTLTHPVGDMRNCELTPLSADDQPVYRMEVLPGGGFDNLRNLDMGLVFAYNYSQCQISADGKYLLPDNVFLIPQQESKLDLFSELFEHWDNYTSEIAASINAGGGWHGISGKLGTGYTRTKTHQFNDNAKTARTQIRHRLYTAKIQPGALLSPQFKALLLEIAANIHDNNTEYAHYLAELLVRDYGTHYVTSVDAGAVIVKKDQLASSYVDQADKNVVRASASVSFFGVASISSAFSGTFATDSGYDTHITHSEISTYGGPPYQPVGFSLSEWEKGVPNSLVAIDRAGDPLFYAINPATLPELPEITVQEIAETVDDAVTRYYKMNSRFGCTDRNSKNVNFQANVDDNSCHLSSTNFSFGGVFQKCSNMNDEANTICSLIEQKNPLTGSFSCPEHYQPILLHEGVVTKYVTERLCERGAWGRQYCHNSKLPRQALYLTYWCAVLPGTDVPKNSGYMFGGFYTSRQSNLLTGTRACPKFYLPLKILQDVTVCVSDSYEAAKDNSLSFGGFESCHSGNPLAIKSTSTPNSWPHDCPAHYTPQLVTVDKDCEINFCIHHDAFDSKYLLPARLPPFRKLPKLKANVTSTLSIVTLDGHLWVKDESGQWSIMTDGPQTGEGLLTQLGLAHPSSADPNSSGITPNENSSPGGLSNGVVATISVITTLLLGGALLAAVFVGKRLRKARKKQEQCGYTTLTTQGSNDTLTTQGSDDTEVRA